MQILAHLIAVVIVIPSVWVATKFILWAIELISRAATGRWRATAKPKGDRLSIYVARFGDGDDEASETARSSGIASIRNELPSQSVEVIPADLLLRLTDGVSIEDAPIKATQKARALLKKKNGSLLIWGQVHAIDGRTVIELRFIGSGWRIGPAVRID